MLPCCLAPWLPGTLAPWPPGTLALTDGKGGTAEATVTFKVKKAPTPGFELALAALALAGAALFAASRKR